MADGELPLLAVLFENSQLLVDLMNVLQFCMQQCNGISDMCVSIHV